MTVLLALIPLVICIALLVRGRYPGERRLRRALEGSPRPLRRLLPSTPMLARGFGVAVRGTVRGRAPPLRPC
jgi:hypothetical protein